MIRVLTALDAQLAYQICIQGHSKPWSSENFTSSLSTPYFAFAIWQNDVLAGYYIGHQVLDEITLMDIVVATDYRGQGLAKRLLVHFLAEAEKLGAWQCLLEVRVSNSPAINLYQANGFVEMDRRKDYYPSEDTDSRTTKEDAIIMQFVFGQSAKNPAQS